MKTIQYVGIVLLVSALGLFASLMFWGPYELKEQHLEVLNKQQKTVLSEALHSQVLNKKYSNAITLSNDIIAVYDEINNNYKSKQEWDKVMWDKPQVVASVLVTQAALTFPKQHPFLTFLLTFGLAILGALCFIIPQFKTLGHAGIKNNGIYHDDATSRGVWAWITLIYLVGFYVLLYFFDAYIVNWVFVVDPISRFLSGNPASKWFLYGFIYCVVMLVMALKMYIKYRHNRYQIVRTTSVLFFQIAFAFLIPEILVRFNLPYMDFKNAWPLDYDFFFSWNVDSLIQNGTIGIYFLVWGIVFSIVIVPVMVYFFGKRWYCSWVCGCGGLAETLGDPYRQHSNKSLKAWKLERWLIHGILVFVVIMTGATLYSYFSGVDRIGFISTYDLQYVYGFFVGSIFSGVIGTGFYPIFGNRVWCRFGCPLAAYMGLVQRFKSRFRITTNGGQCISCGNCSTYCEQGIDVRAYAQKGQNIVRSSCVGCGVCAAVCPRGVLKLENGTEIGRIKEIN